MNKTNNTLNVTPATERRLFKLYQGIEKIVGYMNETINELDESCSQPFESHYFSVEELRSLIPDDAPFVFSKDLISYLVPIFESKYYITNVAYEPIYGEDGEFMFNYPIGIELRIPVPKSLEPYMNIES